MGWHDVAGPLVAPTLVLSPAVRGWLAPAVAKGGHSWEEIEAKLAAGHACVWEGSAGAVFTQVDEDGVCDVVLGGGSGAKAWVADMERAIRAHPAHRDVCMYRIWGRKGWRRLFPHWRFAGVEGGLTVLELDAA